MKSYTDLEQSKKLAKILPIESADMYYVYDRHLDKLYGDTPYVIGYKVLNENVDIPCWSLAALIKMLPKGFQLMDAQHEADLYSVCVSGFNNTHIWKDNPLDAAFEMIIWLKENNKNMKAFIDLPQSKKWAE